MMDPPEDFSFPFSPYPIQKDFMEALFRALEEGKLGIFESPTGTGKSLSLICGALTWLKDFEGRRFKALEEKVKLCDEDDNETDDWFAAAVKKREEQGKRLEAKCELDALKAKQSKMDDLRKRRQNLRQNQIEKVESTFDELFRDLDEVRQAVRKELARSANSSVNNGVNVNEDEEELIVEDYESDNEDETGAREFFEDEEKQDFSLRIYYCSRTHSQLSQFVREVQKTKFSSDVRVVSLASRGNMCINESVVSLKSNHLINDSCLDMQKKSQKGKSTNVDSQTGQTTKRSKTSSGCPFKKANAIESVRDRALLQVQDIEQLVSTGREVKGCPYYGSRQAVEDAQIVIIPYNSMLHKPTRDSLGIRLKNSVVIIDEAHNLLDTISHIHSSEIKGDQLLKTHEQLSQYLERYRSRLKAKNLLYIKQILFIVSSFLKIVGLKKLLNKKVSKDDQNASNCSANVEPSSKLMTVIDFLSETEIFNLNLAKLVQYIEKSKVAIKLRGFSQRKWPKKENQVEKSSSKGVSAFLASLKNSESNKQNANDGDGKENDTAKSTNLNSTSVVSSPLFLFDDFLRSLINIQSDGRILISSNQPDPSNCSIKFLLLNPASSHFGDLVAECRSVIVAGGTMQPVDEFKDQLFVAAGANPDRIVHFSCGHVIPDSNILPMVISKGPSGKTLDFSYQYRNQVELLSEIGRLLINICTVVPGGLICFFTSYDYEALVHKHFEDTGVLERLHQKKKVFREPKSTSEMDQVLRDYGRCAKSPPTGLNGAILLSVVGGKMSEGINFSDDLGRCVVMIGLPFPNSKAPEIRERMNYLDKKCRLVNGRPAGQVYYENLCMKAVNQSIGRAIRHQNDYASILLLDHRFTRSTITGQLPQWIRKCVTFEEKFGPVIPKLKNFYKSKSSF